MTVLAAMAVGMVMIMVVMVMVVVVVVVMFVMVMIMAVVMRMTVLMILHRHLLAFGVAEHQRLDHPAQWILRQRHMRGEEAGEAREPQRLRGKTLIMLCIRRAVGIARGP